MQQSEAYSCFLVGAYAQHKPHFGWKVLSHGLLLWTNHSLVFLRDGDMEGELGKIQQQHILPTRDL